jgi:hypothetical protein
MPFSVSPYHYPPLLSGPGSIRLLRLQPHENENALIQCQLLDAALEEDGRPHAFDALSYVWGKLNDLQSISIDGYDLRVGKQLHEALLRLRHRSSERLVWIDAICINQRDEDEKEQQIQLMARIYNQAKSVVVWLGEEAENSDRALEAIVLAGNGRTISFADEATVRKAVIGLLQRSWFRRIWVLLHNPNLSGKVLRSGPGAPGSCSSATYPDYMWSHGD